MSIAKLSLSAESRKYILSWNVRVVEQNLTTPIVTTGTRFSNSQYRLVRFLKYMKYFTSLLHLQEKNETIYLLQMFGN